MSLLLRGSLSLLFVGMAALIFMFPVSTKKYVVFRYDGLRRFIFSTFSFSVPDKIIKNIPDWGFRILGGIILIGGLAILFHRKWGIMLYAYLVLTIGGVLHVPYDSAGAVSQLRKLIFVVAVFFGLVVLSVQKTKYELKQENAEKEKEKEKEKAKAE